MTNFLKKYFSFSSLRYKIILVILILTLPIAILNIYSSIDQRREAVAEFEMAALSKNEHFAQLIENRVDQIRSLLFSLVLNTTIIQSDAYACNKLLSDIFEQFTGYENIYIANLDGNIFCSAIPLATPLISSDSSWFQQTIKSKDIVLGEYRIDNITGTRSLQVGYAVRDYEGKVLSVLSLLLDLDELNSELKHYYPSSENSILTVYDRNGTILLRNLDYNKWVGKNNPEFALIKNMLSLEEGSHEITDIDGNIYLYSFKSIGKNRDINVISKSSQNILISRINNELFINLITLAVTSFLSIVVVWIGFNYYVIRWLKTLTDSAHKISLDDLSVRVNIPQNLGEISELSNLLNQTLQRLEKQTLELIRTEESMSKNMNMLTEILNLIPQGVFWKNRDGVYLGCNETCAKALGTNDPKKIVGKTDLDLQKNSELAQKYRRDDYDVINKNLSMKHIIEPAQLADGNIIWVDTTKIPLKDEDGKAYGVLGVFEDITERKLRDEELLTYRDNLESLVKGRTRELENKIREIARMNKIFIDREMRMIELKENITKLKKEISDIKQQGRTQ